MDFLDSYKLWCENTYFDEDTRKELLALDVDSDIKEIEDRFYTRLEFGTGGLRGIMGAGTNRMNKYTVGAATLGLARYLVSEYGAGECRSRGVCIGYDTRNNSAYLAKCAADVLSAQGIRVILHDSARPTPQLSFSVAHFGALAGIVITASHNPKEYNGYKVYDEKGCQLVPHVAKRVLSFINEITDFTAISFVGNEALVKKVDVTDVFVSEVMKQSRIDSSERSLVIVYTPLHGTGRVPLLSALEKDGFNSILTVDEQMTEDGNFPTVKSPNPEDRRALLLGNEKAKKHHADIVLGTDPDCDRVGVAVRTDDGYVLMTGNQIGALLMDFIVRTTDLSSIAKPAVVKTAVTSELGAEIAIKHGISVFTTLTGFKFIGEKIGQFEKAKTDGDSLCDFDYVFGYEESYGYLAGTHARDKDAVVSGMLICEMAQQLKNEGKTLCDRMTELYEHYGYYCDALDSFTLSGKDGIERIKSMMSDLRKSASPFDDTQSTIDYLGGVCAEEGFGKLPCSDVLKYILTDGSWIAVRPSGTEPKIKIYYSIKGDDKKTAEKRLCDVQKIIKTKLGLDQ